MAENGHEVKGLVVGLMLGMAIGAILGLLFAPVSGEEARSRVKGFLEELPEKAKELGEKAKQALKRKEEAEA
ncbi:MAG: YtxH domain-containing protein [Candidatus Omnitrophica bacterium]|nr:YtxH domain-containing protein [Candidatus Omnitrophota bacterium]